jgi:hypothetical protein
LGSRILAAMPGKDALTLRLYDIPTGKDVWTRPFLGKHTVLRTEDEDLTGVIDHDTGKLTVLDVGTGKELLSAQVSQFRITLDDVKNLKDPLLLADRERFYVALNQPIDANKINGGFLHNNFNNGLRCVPVNGWVAALYRQAGKHKVDGAWKDHQAGDMAWHSTKKIDNQMLVLEQFDLLPILLFSTRYTELVAVGGGQGAQWRWATQSLQKATGKMIFDSGTRPSDGSAQFESFTLDLRGGTINMLGPRSSIQHYIDDGRKIELPPGVTAMIGPNPNPYLTTPGIDGPVVMPLNRVIRGNIRVAPALPAVPQK